MNMVKCWVVSGMKTILHKRHDTSFFSQCWHTVRSTCKDAYFKLDRNATLPPVIVTTSFPQIILQAVLETGATQKVITWSR